MAASASKKPTKRSRKYSGKKNQQKPDRSPILTIGVAVLVIGLLILGTVQILGLGQDQEANASAIQADNSSLASTSIDDTHQPQSEVDAPVTEANRETHYLGPPSDAAGLVLAEQGEIETPTLVWFHADWCHVCQQIKPEVVNLGEAYEGKVKFVRLNVDYGESRAAVQRYGVRATPTFVLIDAQGQTRGNVPGWPGYQVFTTAFEKLLPEG